MEARSEYDDRLNPFADGDGMQNNGDFQKARSLHAAGNTAADRTSLMMGNGNPFEEDADDALVKPTHDLFEDKQHVIARSSDRVGETGGKTVLKTTEGKTGKFTMLTHDQVARFLLDNQLLLSALEFYTELLDQKVVISQLRDFFSNPGNFELPVADVGNQQNSSSSRLSLNNGGGGNSFKSGGDGNVLYRATSYSTLSDSVSLADVEAINGGTNAETVGSSGRIGLLEYELRRARETIQQLRDSLTTTTSAAAEKLPVIDLTTAEHANNKTINDSVHNNQLKTGHHQHQPLQQHELRALNFLVSEYLVEHGYKLTSITFSDENPEQDFDDWDDVGLNTPKPDSLISIFEQHIASRSGEEVALGSFQRQSSCRTIVGKPMTIAASQMVAKPTERKDFAMQTDVPVETETFLPISKPTTSEIGIQTDSNVSGTTEQIASIFTDKTNSLPSSEAEHLPATHKSHAITMIRNEMYRPDQFQTILLRHLLSTSSLINISPSAAAPVDADELRIHSMIDSISSSSVELRCNNTTSLSCLKFIVPSIILAKRQEIIPMLVEAYLLSDATEVVEQETLLAQLFNLVNKPDDSQRRLLLKALQKICYFSSAQRLEEQFLPLCWSQASHKFPERRQFVAEACAIVSQYVTHDMNSSLVLSTLKQMWGEERVLSVRRSVALSLGVCCSRLYDNNGNETGDEKFEFTHNIFWQCVNSSTADAAVIVDVGLQCLLPLCAYLAIKRGAGFLLRYVEVSFLNRLQHLARRSSGCSSSSSTEDAKQAADDDDDNIGAAKLESRVLILLQSLHVLCTPICAQLISSTPSSAEVALNTDFQKQLISSGGGKYYADDESQIFKLKLFLQQLSSSSTSSTTTTTRSSELLERFNLVLGNYYSRLKVNEIENQNSTAWNDMLLWTSDVFVQQLAKSCVHMPSANAKFINAMFKILNAVVNILNSRVLAQKVVLPTLHQHFEQAVCSRSFSRAAIFPVYFIFSMDFFDPGAAGNIVDGDAGVADAISQLNTLMLATASPPPPVISSVSENDENEIAASVETICADGFIYIFKQILFVFKYSSTSSAVLRRSEALRLLQQLARHPSQNVQLLVVKILAALLETVLNENSTNFNISAVKQTIVDGLSESLLQLAAVADAETRRLCVKPLVLLLRRAITTSADSFARILPLLTALFDEQQKTFTESSVDVAAECVYALNAVDGAITQLDSDTFQHFLLPRLSYMVARTTMSSDAASSNPRRRADLCAQLLQAYVSVTCSPHFAHSPPINASVKQSLLRLQRELQSQQQQQEYLHLCQSLLDKCHFAAAAPAAASGEPASSSSAGVMNKLKGMQPFSKSK